MEHANSQDFSPTDHVDKPTEILSNEHRIIERERTGGRIGALEESA
jgi:hypothetical protein